MYVDSFVIFLINEYCIVFRRIDNTTLRRDVPKGLNLKWTTIVHSVACCMQSEFRRPQPDGKDLEGDWHTRTRTVENDPRPANMDLHTAWRRAQDRPDRQYRQHYEAYSTLQLHYAYTLHTHRHSNGAI